jgi:uncharacterized YigZ family protein
LVQKYTYLTVEGQTEGLYKEKGSKFIGYAAPCENEEQAKELIEIWRKHHHQARHLCYAYRFGVKGEVYRANDDGEPSHSAGTPILGQIQSFELTNVLIGVVRYYGGTKLGVGGLITAYKTAAKEALEAATIVQKEIRLHVKISFDYADTPVVMQAVKQINGEIKQQDFQLTCEMIVALEPGMKDEFLHFFVLNENIKVNELGIY